MKQNKLIILYDLEVWHDKKKMATYLRGVQYGVAAARKKQLIAAGTLPRAIWIVKH